MANDWQHDIQALLANTRIGFLSTVGKTSPETSMCPYALHHGNILLHLSSLAKHSQNIVQHNRVGFMVCTPETKHNSPLSLPRISFTGSIVVVSSPEKEIYQQTYLKHIPDAHPLFSFPDFTLYRIDVDAIFWLGGFGKAHTITKETWKSLC